MVEGREAGRWAHGNIYHELLSKTLPPTSDGTGGGSVDSVGKAGENWGAQVRRFLSPCAQQQSSLETNLFELQLFLLLCLHNLQSVQLCLFS